MLDNDELKNEILFEMEDYLSEKKLRKLEDILDSVISDYQIYHLLTEKDKASNKNILMAYIDSMNLEGKSPKTIDQYKNAVLKLLEDVEKCIPDITTTDIRNHLSTYQQTHNLSKVSIDNKRRCLSAFFSWLTVEEYIDKNPMLRIKKIKQEKIIKRPFTDSELERIRDATTTEKDIALIEFLLSTGCRVSEVSACRITDIDIDRKECIVFGKGSEERKVFLSERCVFRLNKYLRKREVFPPQPLFLNNRGGKMSKESIEKLLKKIEVRSCVENIHPHRFRRTCATNLLNKGMPIQSVQKILGHKSLDTTMQYCCVDEENIRNEHRKYM